MDNRMHSAALKYEEHPFKYLIKIKQLRLCLTWDTKLGLWKKGNIPTGLITVLG